VGDLDMAERMTVDDARVSHLFSSSLVPAAGIINC
jgi:hypothetical protein